MPYAIVPVRTVGYEARRHLIKKFKLKFSDVDRAWLVVEKREKELYEYVETIKETTIVQGDVKNHRVANERYCAKYLPIAKAWQVPKVFEAAFQEFLDSEEAQKPITPERPSWLKMVDKANKARPGSVHVTYWVNGILFSTKGEATTKLPNRNEVEFQFGEERILWNKVTMKNWIRVKDKCAALAEPEVEINNLGKPKRRIVG